MADSVVKHIIVVGAGTAGCVAARTFHDAGHRVTLVEAGGQDTNPAIHVVARLGELWHGPEDWDYRTTPQQHANGRVIHLPRGKVLGGSHALNATIWVRGNPLDYDDWAAAGCPGWSWADVEPRFRELEGYDGGRSHESRERGTEGPIPVVGDYRRNAIFDAIVEAAERVGVPYNDDYNASDQDGISQEQITVQAGKRWTTYMSHVKPLLDSDRFSLVTATEVERLAFDGDRVTGVVTSDGVLEADEVVLSAGAIDTPKILLRSGIGPASHLRDVGIDPVHDLQGVGENLHDHLLAPVIAAVERTIEHPDTDWSVTQTHLFWRSRPGLDRPDTQPIHFAVPMYDEGMEGPENAFTLHAGIVRPRSRGTLRLTGPGVDDPVLLDLNIFSDPEDKRALLASLQQARAMVREPALRDAWGARELYPGAEVEGEEAELAYIDRWVTTYHHQVGTCRMGTTEDAVVDPATMRVRGLDGVRIIDASVMPTVTTGNTNAPSAMIGLHGARLALADQGS